MNFDDWVTKFNGTKIDYDKVYGVQCVDLIKHFIDNVLGVYPQSIGNAIDYYNKRYTSEYLKRNFVWYDNTPSFVPQKGDIVVFKSQSPAGHIAVCNGIGDTHKFQAYDENYNGTHAGMTLRTFEYSGKRTALGFHRPKDQSHIILGGWQLDDDGWYFIENGKVVTNTWKQDNQGWLYLDENGRIATNQWKQDTQGWLYLGNDGHPIKNQWMQDSVGWCHLDNDGYMKTNAWQQDSDGWCFVTNDGHLLRNGYAWDSFGKHYLDDTGHMKW